MRYTLRRILRFGVDFSQMLRVPLSTRRDTRSEKKMTGNFFINKILWNRYPFQNILNDHKLKLPL